MFDTPLGMLHSADILGPMSESERHVLMQRALRAKHLRFLREQKVSQYQDRSSLSGTSKEESPSPRGTPSPAVAGFGHQTDHSGSAVGGARLFPPRVLPTQNNQEQPKDGGVLAKDQQNTRLTSQAIEALNLRRLLDCGKLTQEQYSERLDWMSSVPLPQDSSLPRAVEILRSLIAARAGNKSD
jgi:hypothetical protein